MAKWIISLIFTLSVLIPVRAGGSVVRTDNFVVEAPTREMAEEFARLAEKYRREKAIEWLGQEMPNWKNRCPLRIIPASSAAEGATTFDFGRGTQDMYIKGPIERLKNSVLPHEITHTVFAHHFKQPVPRWADEGGSVYSEDDLERRRHDKMSVQYLNAGRAFLLTSLFAMKDYPANPSEQMILYAEGYSISKYLIEQSDRQTFLNFVNDGMHNGWDRACQKYYEVKNVNELQTQWIDFLRKSARGDDVASTPRKSAPPATVTSRDSRSNVRSSDTMAQPQLDPLPVARGSSPSVDRTSKADPAWENMPRRFYESAPAQFPSCQDCNSGNCTNGSCPAKNSNTSNRSGRNSDPQLPPPAVLLPPEVDRP
ncbi:hypothetical protein KIH39_02955 [Telmatocola sphagniphila]|uniref:Uncharacterized protein n=1 Tax=Telmatocola sphagniphila TaxID=1123043 RepID=A0A8E6B6Q5_9BACT|nr:hypothetical protein [Telmatocola sphagniphila]QVL32893.1 hypothetical protein KIH39_02955 [Telmatocola sphagniphila]